MATYRGGEAKVRVTPDLSRFREALQAELRSIDADLRVDIQADLNQLRRELDAELARDRSATINVDADVAAAETTIDAMARDRSVDLNVDADTTAADTLIAATARDRTATIEVDVDTDRADRAIGALADGLVRAASATSSLGLISALISGIGVAAAGAIGPLSAMVGVLVSLAPAMVGVGAGVTALGAGVATLVIGFQGMGEAMGALGGDAAELEAALADLAPAAAETVRAVGSFKDAWSELQQEVQGNLFEGIGDAFTSMAERQLPVLHEGLSGISSALNDIFLGGLRAFGTDYAADAFGSTLGYATTMFENMSESLANVSSWWIIVSSGMAQYLPAIGTWVNDVTQGWEDWANSMRAVNPATGLSGFEELAGRVRVAWDQTSNAISTVWGIMSAVFGAAAEAGGSAFGPIMTVLEEFNTWANSTAGQTELVNFFTQMQNALGALMPAIGELGNIFITVLMPAMAELMEAAGPGIHQGLENLRAVLEALAPAAGPVGSVIGALATALIPLLPLLGPIALGLKGVQAALAFKSAADAVGGIGKLSTGLKNILKVVGGGFRTAFTLAAGAVRALTMAMIANPIGAIIAAVVAVVAALVYFFTQTETGKRIWADFVEFLGQAWDKIKEWASAAWEWIVGIWNGLGEWFSGVWDSAVAGVSGAWDSVKEWASDAWDSVKSTWDGLSGWFSGLWDGTKETAKSAWDGVVNAANDAQSGLSGAFDRIGSAWDGVKSLLFEGDFTSSLRDAFGVEEDNPIVGFFLDSRERLIGVWNAIVGFVTNAWTNFTAFASGVWSGITTVFTTAWNNLVTVVTTVWTFIQTWVMTQWTMFTTIVSTIWNLVTTIFTNAWNTLMTIVTNVWSFIQAWIMARWMMFTALVSTVWNLVTTVFSNVWNRIRTVITTVWSAVSTWITTAWNNILNFARTVFNNILTTITNVWNNVRSKTTEVWNAVKSRVTEAVNNMIDKVREFVSNIRSKFDEAAGKVREFPGKIKSAFANAGSWLIESGKAIIRGLINGIKSMAGRIGDAIRSIVPAAVRGFISFSAGGISFANGGVTNAPIAMANGGVQSFAGGGTHEDHTAQIAPAGAWRVWAEPETGGEAYIPLAPQKRNRSTAILSTVANHFGYRLTDTNGENVEPAYRGNLGPQDTVNFADGGITGDKVSAQDLDNFVGGSPLSGGNPARPLDGAPYDWGGINWGDCSGAVSAVTRAAVGLSPFAARFATANEGPSLESMGFLRGLGPSGSLNVGFYNGGAGGGHTSMTLPSGTAAEMRGGGRGGIVGGDAWHASHPNYTDHFHLPPDHFQPVSVLVAEDESDLDPTASIPDLTTDPTTVPTTTDPTSVSGAAGAGVGMDSEPTTISGIFGKFAQTAVEGQVKDALGVIGMPDDLPPVIKAFQQYRKAKDAAEKNPDSQLAVSDLEDSTAAVVDADPSAETTTIAKGQLSPPNERDVISGGGGDEGAIAPEAPTSGPDYYAYEIARNARSHTLPLEGAKIGLAVALVESGDPLKMYANRAVPASLNYPHDAVGSDHDSVGLFQQRDNGAWGTLDDRMDPYRSAGLFYDAMLRQYPDWASREPGAVAQGVQRSAFPDRYATKMGRGEELARNTGLYDQGGVLEDESLALNLSGKPEAILTNDQWMMLRGLASTATQAAGGLAQTAAAASGIPGAPMLASMGTAAASTVVDTALTSAQRLAANFQANNLDPLMFGGDSTAATRAAGQTVRAAGRAAAERTTTDNGGASTTNIYANDPWEAFREQEKYEWRKAQLTHSGGRNP